MVATRHGLLCANRNSRHGAEIVRRILDDPAFATAVKDMLIRNVYERQKTAQAED